MVKNHNVSPFLFPSSSPSYSSESTPQSPLSSSPYARGTTSSLSSPYKPSPSIPEPLLSQSSSIHPDDTDAAASGPCAACKSNGRQCSDQCYLASYFPSNVSHKFGVVDTVFGWGDLHNFLQLQKNSNSSNYTPLLFLLKDASEDGEVQSNLKNCDLSESSRSEKEGREGPDDPPVPEILEQPRRPPSKVMISRASRKKHKRRRSC